MVNGYINTLCIIGRLNYKRLHSTLNGLLHGKKHVTVRSMQNEEHNNRQLY